MGREAAGGSRGILHDYSRGWKEGEGFGLRSLPHLGDRPAPQDARGFFRACKSLVPPDPGVGARAGTQPQHRAFRCSQHTGAEAGTRAAPGVLALGSSPIHLSALPKPCPERTALTGGSQYSVKMARHKQAKGRVISNHIKNSLVQQ